MTQTITKIEQIMAEDTKFKLEKCKTSVIGLSGFIIRDSETNEPLSRISVRYITNEEYSGYIVFKSKMPSNNMTSDDFLGVLVRPRSCDSPVDIKIYEQIEVKESIINGLERELERLHEESNSQFDVGSYLAHLGFKQNNKGIYPGIRNLLLDDLVRHSPQYSKEVEKYKESELALQVSSSEE